MLSTLYNVEINIINYHIKKIYNDNELNENSTSANYALVLKEGNREVSGDLQYCNLDMFFSML